MLHSRFTEMFGLDYPIMSAPMALHSGGTLAGAVSSAGGLGSFGAINPSGDPAWLNAEVATIRHETDRPFAIGFISEFIQFFQPLFDATLAARPAAVALSFGDPEPWIVRCKAVDIKVICQVQDFSHADSAVEAGADVLVAQGHEAGGHTGRIGTLPLLVGIGLTHPDVPLLAAGGIGDGKTLAAVLAAGADGAWMGTAFLATPEAVEVDAEHKRLVVESDGSDTVFTHTYDIVSGSPWPDGIGERVRRNRFTEEWMRREAELRAQREEVAARRSETEAREPDIKEIIYGQSARFVVSTRSAADVLRTVCEEAERQLRQRSQSVLR